MVDKEDKCLCWPKNGLADTLNRTVDTTFGPIPG